jgi:hypothetical protein
VDEVGGLGVERRVEVGGGRERVGSWGDGDGGDGMENEPMKEGSARSVFRSSDIALEGATVPLRSLITTPSPPSPLYSHSLE